MLKTLNKVQSRPGMYLAAYDQRLDAASVYANFLIGIFYRFEFGRPQYVSLVTSGCNFAITSVGCQIDTATQKLGNLSYIFDVVNSQTPVLSTTYPSLTYLRSIVWLTEYCLIDITQSSGTYRQAFLYGSALEEAILVPSEGDNTPRISFCFTLSSRIFESTLLDIQRLERVITVWKERDFAQLIKDANPVPELQFKWFKQNQYYHSLEITSGE
ncbi:MAG: hypothetical protein IT322_21875 [Anaerolineae bacterium]|nr:hypothetical protein [Anaerolineae bacterium]